MSGNRFCVVPWINASVDVNGSFRPCCKFEQPDQPGATQLGNLQNNSLQELWNGKPMQKLRQEFLNGERPTGCKACWDEEAAGVVSLRQEFTKYRIRSNEELSCATTISEAPLALDLKLSNKCNLKCRICGPVASSTFLQEEQNSPGGFEISEEQKNYLTAFKFLKNEKETAWFKKSIPNIQHIELFGGEPLLGEENRQLVALLKASGYASNISLLYNTNSTLFDENLVNDWKSFRRVQVCLSIDDIDERIEYQRFPTKWPVVQKNIAKYANSFNDIKDVVLFCTVSLFNVYYIPEYLQWHAKDFKKIYLNLNFVHSPDIFNIVSLPMHAKDAIKEKYAKFEDTFDCDASEKLKQILNFMYSQESFREQISFSAKNEILMRDKIRSQNFEKIFPEWSKILYPEGF